MSDSLWPHGLQHAKLLFTISRSLLKFMCIELMMPYNHLIVCRPLHLLPSIFQSIRVFSSEPGKACIRWPKYWSFSCSISLSNIHIQGSFPLGLTGLISLLSKGRSRVFSGTLVQKHQLFGVQPSLRLNSHICTWLLGKNKSNNIALIVWNFVRKMMSLLLSILSRFVIAFSPRSKCLLISWLQSPSAVILEPKKIKICHYFHFFPFYFPWSDGTGCQYLSFMNGEF